MRQLGKFNFNKMDSLQRTNSPGIATKYLQLRMNSSNKGSPDRRKFKSPKRKSPSAKNLGKRTSSSKKLNKSPKRPFEMRSVLRKGSLGLIEKYKNQFTS
jgi:hypothetical protein